MTADEIKVLERIFDTKLEPIGKQLDRVEKRVEKVEERLEGVEGRLDGVEKRLGNVEVRLTHVEEELTEFKTNTESALLVITERLNQTAEKEDLHALEVRVATLEHHHNN